MSGFEVSNWSFGDTLIRTVSKGYGESVTLLEKDDVWFVAKDVAVALGYDKTQNLTDILDEDEITKCPVQTSGGVQEMIVMSEAGVYHAVFMSRKEEARAFRRWVTGEVLPEIRRRGYYAHSASEDVLVQSQLAQIQLEQTKALLANAQARDWSLQSRLLTRLLAAAREIKSWVDEGVLKQEDFFPYFKSLVARTETGENLMDVRNKKERERAFIISFVENHLELTGNSADFIEEKNVYNMYIGYAAEPVTEVRFKQIVEDCFRNVEYKCVCTSSGILEWGYTGLKNKGKSRETKMLPDTTQEA